MPSHTKKRCPNGTRRSKKTGLCEPKKSPTKKKVVKSPKNKVAKTAKKKGIKTPKKVAKSPKTKVSNRCLKGSTRNKKTGLCESKIFLDDYISDIKNFYDISYVNTLWAFKHDKNHDITKYVLQIFNYDKNDLRKIYMNRQTILGFFIISGYMNEFKKILKDSVILKLNDYPKDINVKNLEIYRKDNKFKLQDIKNNFIECIKIDENDCTKCNNGSTKSNQLYDFCNSGIFKFIYNSIKNMKFDTNLFKNYFSKDDKEYEISEKDVFNTILLKLSIFIYYFLNVDRFETATSIMNQYVLYFLKSGFKNTYNIKIFNKQKNDLIDTFLLTNSFYKILPFQSNLEFDSERKFSTCGESTILNILNYYIIDNVNGNFKLELIENGSDELKTFYNKYKNMKSQMTDIRKTTKDFLYVVSNLENTPFNIYDVKGDISPNVKNMTYVIKTILNSDKDNLNDIFNNKFDIVITKDTPDNTELILDDTYFVSLTTGHAYMDILNKKQYNNQLDINVINDNDFKMMYGIIDKINYEDIYLTITNVWLANYSKTNLIDNHIYKVFLNTISGINIQNKSTQELNNILSGALEQLPNLKTLGIIKCNGLTRIPDIITEFTKLEMLYMKRNSILSIPSNIDKLINLKELYLAHNFIKDIPDSVCNLINLEKLILYQNDINNISDNIGKLENLKVLNIRTNRINKIPDSIGNLVNLELLNLSNNQIRSIPNSILNLTNLKILNLQNNMINRLPSAIKDLNIEIFKVDPSVMYV